MPADECVKMMRIKMWVTRIYGQIFLHYTPAYNKSLKTISIINIAPLHATSQSTRVSCAVFSGGLWVLGRGADCRRLHNASPVYYDSPLRSAITLIQQLLFKDFVDMIISSLYHRVHSFQTQHELNELSRLFALSRPEVGFTHRQDHSATYRCLGFG